MHVSYSPRHNTLSHVGPCEFPLHYVDLQLIRPFKFSTTLPQIQLRSNIAPTAAEQTKQTNTYEVPHFSP